MANPNPGWLSKPLGLQHMGRALHTDDPVTLAAFIANMPLNYSYEVHDFLSAIETAHWTAAKTSGGTETDFAFNAQRGGALRGATGTDTNNVVALHKAQTYFDAADNPFMIVRWKAPAAVTSFVYEIGFSDPKTSEVTVSVSDIDTPTIANGVTDAVLIARDTSQTLTTSALLTVGTTDTTAAKSNLATHAPTASKWQLMIVGVRSRKGYAAVWDDGALVAETTLATGPDTGVLMRPSLLFKTLNTTTKQIDIDLIVLGTERNAT